MKTSSRGLRFFWLLGLVLLLGSALGAGWVLNQPVSGTGVTSASEAMSYGIVGIGYADVENGLTFLNPVQPGRVDHVWVREGEPVHEGEMLISLDNRNAKLLLAAAEADLAAAERALKEAETTLVKKWEHEVAEQTNRLAGSRKEQIIAENELQIQQKLFDDKFMQINKEQLEIAKNKLEVVKAVVKTHEAALAKIQEMKPQGLIDRAREDVKAKAARRDQARLAYLECDVYAPADGVVMRLFATPGDLLGTAQQRQPAIHFCPNKQRIIRVEVLQEWASKVQPGQSAFIEDDTRSGTQWKGKVVRVSDWFTHRRAILQEPFQYNDVRTLECIVYLDAGSRPVRIGQRVRVTIK